MILPCGHRRWHLAASPAAAVPGVRRGPSPAAAGRHRCHRGAQEDGTWLSPAKPPLGKAAPVPAPGWTELTGPWVRTARRFPGAAGMSGDTEGTWHMLGAGARGWQSQHRRPPQLLAARFPAPSPVRDASEQTVSLGSQELVLVAREEPNPTGEEPNPAAKEPNPAEEEPDPTREQPNPAGEEPNPAGEEPDLAGEEPNPIKEEPNPTEEEPDPTREEPNPTEEEPHPAEEELNPAEEEPDPTREQPNPAGEEPNPAKEDRSRRGRAKPVVLEAREGMCCGTWRCHPRVSAPRDGDPPAAANSALVCRAVLRDGFCSAERRVPSAAGSGRVVESSPVLFLAGFFQPAWADHPQGHGKPRRGAALGCPGPVLG